MLGETRAVHRPRVHGCEKYAVPREEIADERWGDPRGRYMKNLHSPISVVVAAPYARGLSRPRRSTGPQHQRVPVPRSLRHKRVDPNGPTAPRGPGPRRGRPQTLKLPNLRGVFSTRTASSRSALTYSYKATCVRSTPTSVRPALAASGTSTSRRRPAVAASRRRTPTARKPAPTTTRKPAAPRRLRPTALSVTRGPPRFTDLRAAGVHRPDLATPSQRRKLFGPDPLTHRRELWSRRRDAATPGRIAQERVFSAAFLGAARTDLSALA